MRTMRLNSSSSISIHGIVQDFLAFFRFTQADEQSLVPRSVLRFKDKVQEVNLPGGGLMSFYVSELSLKIDHRVPYFGEVNLLEVYKAIEPIRQKAGYMAVHIKRAKSKSP
jgi:hypothetical protein